MSSPVLHVSPEVLRWARLSSGIALVDAARSAVVDPEVLARWEGRQATPTARQLENLADAYKRPVALLLRAHPPDEPPLPADFRRLPRARRRSLSAASRLAIRRARRVQRVYAEVAREALERQRRLPKGLREDPEEAAAFARDTLSVTVEAQLQWRSPEAAVRHWRSALEEIGVLTVRLSIPVEELRGFSLPGRPPLIAITNRDPHGAQSFTLFHEWGHLLLGGSGLCRPNELTRSLQGDDEVFCNAFAGAALVPMSALVEHPAVVQLRAGVSDAGVVAAAVARAFSVSRFVAIRRLLTARAVTHDEYGKMVGAWLRQPTTVRRSRFGPEPAVRVVSELGRSFVSAVLAAQQRGAIAETDLADYLSLSSKHVERVSELIGV